MEMKLCVISDIFWAMITLRISSREDEFVDRTTIDPTYISTENSAGTIGCHSRTRTGFVQYHYLLTVLLGASIVPPKHG
jgi:hypothetical protein